MEAEFKQHHQAVIDVTKEEDEAKLHDEQVIDDHDDKVSDFMD